MRVFNSVEELIGNTPIIQLNKLKEKLGLKANLFAKLEFYNPAGSVKDRVALQILEDAEQKGIIGKGSVIIEPTSGNTGIGLALVAAVRGYKTIIVMPDNMSIERQQLIKAYGAEVVLTKGALGMKGAVAKAEEIASKTKGAFIAGQFENPSNPLVHFKTTGPELLEALDGKIDAFVAGAGTGGTVSGCGKFLKANINNIEIVAVEPEASPLLSKGVAGPHKIQGIGANFVPQVLNRDVIDNIVTVSNEDAFFFARRLATDEGILCGISSGANLAAAVQLAKKEEYTDKNIVFIVADSGVRYLSSGLYEE